MIKVLFVCLGNICRSPMAEAIFAHQVREAGLAEHIEADSAGTGDWHIGSPPHPGTAAILARNSIRYEGRGRVINGRDLRDFDYIVTMDDANLRDVQRLGESRGHVSSLLSHAANAAVSEVPDPYFTGDFETVYSLVEAGCRGLLEAIRREHGL